MSRTSLYRHIDVHGTLLYVGIASDITYRTFQHDRDASWVDMIHTIRVEHFPTREAALRAEIVAIATERPVYNARGRSDGKKPGTLYGGWAVYDHATGLADGWYFKYEDVHGVLELYREERPDLHFELVHDRNSEVGKRARHVLTTTAPLIVNGPSFGYQNGDYPDNRPEALRCKKLQDEMQRATEVQRVASTLHGQLQRNATAPYKGVVALQVAQL